MNQLGVEVAQPLNITTWVRVENTEWIIGIAVNTGHDTKIMMSARETEPKTSVLDKVVSVQIGRIIILLVFFCFLSAMGNAAESGERR